MGAVAQALADAVVLTSDNPRDEVPAAILTQIVAGIEAMAQVVVIEDRGAAIAHAVQNASATDVILLAGKGHEATQEVAGQKRVFSDLAQAGVALRQRARGRA
jgi:UDP-N-acetylmuramyl tripeptide synthase